MTFREWVHRKVNFEVTRGKQYNT